MDTFKQKQAELAKSVQPYAAAHTKSSIIQMLNTFIPFAVLLFLAYQSLAFSVWLSLPFSIAAAFFNVRLFIIFHDCTHMSFFSSRKANRIIGNITGVLTHFPYEKWKNEHLIHHSSSGNLDKRGIGDIWIMTVNEFEAASFWEKIAYRVYRHPLVLFGLGAFHLLLVQTRFNRKGAKPNEKWNTRLINLTLVVLYALLVWAFGWKAVLLVHGPMLYLSAALGIWLFYVQHQFEDSYFEDDDNWNYVKAAVDGSSFYQLPKVLQWLTGNIGYHHVHHLSPRVPNYQLEQAHLNVTPLQKATTITLKTSLESLKFRLFDEENRMFISFKTYKQRLRLRQDAPVSASAPSQGAYRGPLPLDRMRTKRSSG